MEYRKTEFEKILIRIRGVTIIINVEKNAGCPKVAETLIPKPKDVLHLYKSKPKCCKTPYIEARDAVKIIMLQSEFNLFLSMKRIIAQKSEI
ncbi:NTP pyrophosphohydrolases including oxidative damage repair enzymes [Candidatus Scalindua japonica]|uniref:NTP pyrophosphohydrolases including oxidative damage repair enzymes n=1 Tax=Candidatus Scalindua japonica TaxID=1284222 RepID=A0A286U3V2_9BACT|nr:NTP pyrophosphohydrolases including oxidative damage repair enzymes [Candidatus Scalindua japonica]